MPSQNSNTVQNLTGRRTETLHDYTQEKRIKIITYEKELNSLDNLKKNKGKSAAIYSLRDRILGKKKTQQEQIYLKDPDSGEEIYSPKKLKKLLGASAGPNPKLAGQRALVFNK